MTKILKTLPCTKEVFAKLRNETRNETKDELLDSWIDEDIQQTEDVFNSLIKDIEGRLADVNNWVYMSEKDVYYVPSIVGLIPNLKNHKCISIGGYDTLTYCEKDITFSGFRGVIPSKSEAIKCFCDVDYFRNGNYVQVCGDTRYFVYYKAKKRNKKYAPYNNTKASDGSWSDAWLIPIYRFNGVDAQPISAGQTLYYWLENELKPDENWFANKSEYSSFCRVNDIYNKFKEYILISNEKLIIDREKFKQARIAGKVDFIIIDKDVKTLLDNNSTKEDNSIKVIKDYCEALIEKLLTCDNVRANLDVYDRNLLFDPNRGHWDLWDWLGGEEQAGEIVLDEPRTARNPADDINHGIVAIDFGTKGTVVVYENEHMQTLPLQVGSGNYSAGVKAKNYENPTIIQFIDIQSFIEDYAKKAGRPPTKWEEVTVSHTAFANLNNSSSEKYYSFFDNIKQWCGSDNMRIKIKDDKGTVKDLPPFMEVIESDINPVEIYAYYLGLYINNMLQEKHIFLQYIMSFPVTYDRGIREKMRRCFEAGLKKSLPTALLSNEEAMKNFKVQEGASEPAAYAITALEEFEFDPEDDEENYYAVFDFGGGTTDFDFGVFREAKADRYDYDLFHFGSNGDKTLGGENILKLLAFEVFKANKDVLLKPKGDDSESNAKIPFTWSADKKDFVGSEGLIKDSQEANINMHNLMEALRDIWENPISEEAQKILNEGEVKLNLFTDEGEQLTFRYKQP